MSRFFLLLLLLPGCLGAIDGLDPQVGDPLAARCSNTDSDPDKEVSFQNDVQPILRGLTNEPGCGCHLPTDPNPIGLEETGLDLSSYSGLVAGGGNSSGGVFNAGAPCDSVIWKKISPGPAFGARMPFNGPPFLSQAARQLVSDWIAEGARDN
jgi:hypothetical protein